jgi:hypothetical protein
MTGRYLKREDGIACAATVDNNDAALQQLPAG